MTFKIGMPVVCIGIPALPPPGKQFPKKGRVYTIRGIEPYKTWSILFFEEIRNAPCLTDGGFREQGFGAAYFRPAVSPKQEVSFTTGADPDSERFDNRRAREKAWGCSA